MHLGDETSRAVNAAHTREIIHQERSQQEVIAAIRDELARQRALKAAGRFDLTPADLGLSDVRCAVVLMAGVGKVARAICDRKDVNLYEELVQVAAVALGWASRLRRQWLSEPADKQQLGLFPAEHLQPAPGVVTLAGKENESE